MRLNFDANLQSVLTRLLGVGSLDSTYKISPEGIPLNNQDFQLGINQQIAQDIKCFEGPSHNRLLFLLSGGDLKTLNITISNDTNKFSYPFEVINEIFLDLMISPQGDSSVGLPYQPAQPGRLRGGH